MVGHGHGQLKCQHGGEMHRPDAAPHSQAAPHDPEFLGQVETASNSVGYAKCGIRGEKSNDV